MKIFVAFGDCGDYYCDGEHFLGAFDKKELAEHAATKYIKEGRTHPGTDNSARSTGIGEFSINELNPDNFVSPRLYIVPNN